MMSNPHVAQSHVHRREIDLPTRQALELLRDAVNRLRELEAVRLDSKTVAERARHARMVKGAIVGRDCARAALESLLIDDEDD